MIIATTTKDIEFVKEKLEIPYGINSSVVSGLLSVNGCSTLVEDEINVASILYAVAMNDLRSGTVAKVIAIWGATQEKAMSLALKLTTVVAEVHLSKDCVRYLGLASSSSEWTRLETIVSQDVTEYVDESTYSYKFKNIAKSFSTVSEYLDTAASSRDSWLGAENTTLLRRLLSGEVVEHYPGVYSFPLLSKFMCRTLLHKAKEYKYSVNGCEEAPYQIPEVVLEVNDRKMYSKLVSLFNTSLPAITHSLYACRHSCIRSIQLARYSSDDIASGNWHVDMDSDLTLVVSLNDDYSGGGTAIKPYGSESEVIVESLPVGHALLFRGKHFMHKGLPVTKGKRDILVFWAVS